MSVWRLTEEHHLFQKSVRRWVEEQLAPHLEEMEQNYEGDTAYFVKLGELGFLASALTEEQGGYGDALLNVLLLEELGTTGSMGFAQLVKQHLLGMMLLAQQDELSDLIMQASEGKRVVTFVQTAIETDTLPFVVNGLAADILVVLQGTQVTVYDLEDAHIRKKNQSYTMGWRTANLATLQVGEATPILTANLTNEQVKQYEALANLYDGAISYGMMRGVLAITKAYTQQRIQFGGPLTQFQVVRHKLVDIAIEKEKLRHLVYQVAYLQDQAAFHEQAICLRFYTESMLPGVMDTAQQVHGGNGYMMEYDVQRYWRDAEMYAVFNTKATSLAVFGEQLLKNPVLEAL